MDWKFDIGQTVRHAGCEPLIDQLWSQEHRLFIVERLHEECHGGIQRFYLCRTVSSSGGTSEQCKRLSENELVASEPFKADRMVNSKPFTEA